MILNLNYFDGTQMVKCSLIEQIGTEAIIRIQTNAGKSIRKKVNFDDIRVAKKRPL